MSVWSDYEISILIDCYEKKKSINEIIVALNGMRSEAAIRNKARDLKITNPNSWTDDEIIKLKNAYENGISTEEIYDLLNKRHSIGSIRCKAQSLKLFKHNNWTSEEEAILIEYYENTYFYKIQEMIPNHPSGSITWKANKLGLQPFIFWTDKETKYIEDNWMLEPDFIMAKHLNRSERAVVAKRAEMQLLRRNSDVNNTKYLSNFFRVNITDWKKDSMKECNYQCVFTGSKNFDIHHLYSMHYIVKETLSELNYDENDIYTKNYSDIELKNLLSKFKSIHSRYPLGVCISPKIHQLYHKLYGSNNFPEQWYKFKEDFENGVYDDILNEGKVS